MSRANDVTVFPGGLVKTGPINFQRDVRAKRTTVIAKGCAQCGFCKRVEFHFSKTQLKRQDAAKCNECIAGLPPQPDAVHEEEEKDKRPPFRGVEGTACWGCTAFDHGHKVECKLCADEIEKHMRRSITFFCTEKCWRDHKEEHMAYHWKRMMDSDLARDELFDMYIGQHLSLEDIEQTKIKFAEHLRMMAAMPAEEKRALRGRKTVEVLISTQVPEGAKVGDVLHVHEKNAEIYVVNPEGGIPGAVLHFFVLSPVAVELAPTEMVDGVECVQMRVRNVRFGEALPETRVANCAPFSHQRMAQRFNLSPLESVAFFLVHGECGVTVEDYWKRDAEEARRREREERDTPRLNED
jgi:hypothetical protein